VRFSELDGRSIGVWGAGREIRSFADQLRRRLPRARIAVVAVDDEPVTDLRRELGLPHARVVSGPDSVAALAGCEAVVRSPGVSTHRPDVEQLRGAGIPVTTATALWLAERGGRGVIGVTGTKGKSTTAALAFHLAASTGRPARLAGNIGSPALDLLDSPEAEPAVVELSSYQIADLVTGPEVVVITNLYREHLDWHGTEEAYRADKLRIMSLPGVRTAVVNAADGDVRAAAAGTPTVLYGSDESWHVLEGGIADATGRSIRAGSMPLRGEHNALNLCAALTALGAYGIEVADVEEALRGFHALPHRLEPVADRDGVVWVDDSISTTPESALAAIATFADREIVLLGGGQERGQDYSALADVLAARRAAVVGLPTTGHRLVEAARRAGIPATRALEAADMETAVERARSLAAPGTAVLLSPAAPSYNAYRNFEERGDHFRALVLGG
jgi:UDP-N-acetylmuramoyl-L-alanine---L-glutamate ligase